MTEQELIDAFESGLLPNEAFHHRDHVRLAWAYFRREAALCAIFVLPDRAASSEP